MLTISDSNYLNIFKHGIVLVDFTADWCQPCKGVNEILKQLEPQYKNIVFVRVNVDQAPNIAAKYNINSIPTVMFIIDGIPATMLVGSKCTLTNIKKVLDTL